MTAKELRSWQKDLSLSQIEAAKELCVATQTYRNWVCARSPIPKWVDKMTKLIDEK